MKKNKNSLSYQIKTHGYDFISKLEKLIDPELKQLVIDEEKEEAVDLCDESKAMNLAALLRWFELHNQKKHGNNLVYYCWLNHEAFDVTYYWLALCPEPYRTNSLRKHLSFENREQILKYIEDWWTKHSIQCLYPSCNLFDEKTVVGSDSWQRWQLYDLEKLKEGYSASYIGTDDNFMFTKEIIPLDKNSVVMPEEMLPVYDNLFLEIDKSLVMFWKSKRIKSTNIIYYRTGISKER